MSEEDSIRIMEESVDCPDSDFEITDDDLNRPKNSDSVDSSDSDVEIIDDDFNRPKNSDSDVEINVVDWVESNTIVVAVIISPSINARCNWRCFAHLHNSYFPFLSGNCWGKTLHKTWSIAPCIDLRLDSSAKKLPNDGSVAKLP